MDKPAESFKCHMVSWDEAHLLAKDLARKVKRSGYKPDLIIGIARGGLVPARIMCDYLLQKDLASIKIEHWGIAATRGKAKIKYALPAGLDISGKRILVVDDVADTGESYAVVMDYINGLSPAEIRTAALHYKTNSTFIPDYWSEKQDAWKWIIYPWAVYEDLFEFIGKILSGPMTHSDISAGLKRSYDIKIPGKDLLEILGDMRLADKLRRIRRGRKVFWEKT
ncbi:MAG: phosphoribosyltransferase [Candidatus Methanoperedens sp.]|nr:phosphoribosyltransferase [Candidatus Methanoperedens sp.]